MPVSASAWVSSVLPTRRLNHTQYDRVGGIPHHAACGRAQAIALAAAIEGASNGGLAERATSAVDALLAELAQATAGKPGCRDARGPVRVPPGGRAPGTSSRTR